MDRGEQIKSIVEKVCGVYDLSLKSRDTEYIHARAIYLRICQNNFKIKKRLQSKRIGLTHATILHSLKTFEVYMKDEDFKRKYKKSLTIFNEMFFKDIPYIDTISLDDLKDKHIVLNSQYSDLMKEKDYLKNKLDLLIEVKDLMEPLTDSQKETFIDRMKAYVKICKDQNKRNELHIRKHEHNYKSHS